MVSFIAKTDVIHYHFYGQPPSHMLQLTGSKCEKACDKEFCAQGASGWYFWKHYCDSEEQKLKDKCIRERCHSHNVTANTGTRVNYNHRVEKPILKEHMAEQPTVFVNNKHYEAPVPQPEHQMAPPMPQPPKEVF